MIGIKIKGEFLDMPPRASTQVERNTPLILGDENLGELTFPITIPATGRNVRLLGFITELGKLKTDSEIKHEAEYYEHSLLQFKGTLVAEYTNTNLNYPDRGQISVYFLTAISAFYAAAKNVMLQDLDLGGDRQISGFLEHFAATWEGNADSYDYVFCPIKNEAWMPVDDLLDEFTFMNPVWILNGELQPLTIVSQNRFIPFPYIRYLLIQSFKYFGYTVSGDILEDPDFKKAFTPAFNALYWGYWMFNPLPELVVLDPVVLNLRNHVPRDYPVTKFLFSLGNLLGLGYDINVTTKHCVIRRMNTLPSIAARKDMTPFVDPVIKSEFTKDDKIYAIKQNFDPSDTRVNRPDLASYKRIADITDLSQLPPADALNENNISLLIPRNWFYVCEYNPDTIAYEWHYLCDNLYDYEPDGNNETIETSITPVTHSVVKWSHQHFDGLFPHIEQVGNWPGKKGEYSNWELRILYYHGLQQDASGNLYPFASSHHYNQAAIKIGSYSLTLTAPEGLVEKFWQNWLQLLSSMEMVDMVLFLNLKQYTDLAWTDFILIRNTPYLLTQLTPQSPYNDRLPAKALRVNLTKVMPPPLICTAAIGDLSATVTDDNKVIVDWEDSSPGATSWRYSFDGGTILTVYEHPIVLIGMSPGPHSITVVPVCANGAPNPNGGQTTPFTIPVPALKIQLSAVLTTGMQPNNKLRLTATASTPVSGFLSFNFGQCTFNTGSNQQACRAYPGAIAADQYTTVSFITGDTTHTVDSVYFTPGADFGFITKIVVFGLVGITAAQIEKAPGQTWALEVRS